MNSSPRYFFVPHLSAQKGNLNSVLFSCSPTIKQYQFNFSIVGTANFLCHLDYFFLLF
ncbi:hypothetical protein FGIG_10277 [Fasciola gigantica]|uniref:Uncharacterized protein n=1 Tax=Fasciola gigantica TaxID=46835 RepID=A0A504YYV3_FASGI|nr:hypothetical protein FGIG_10277 [Fasciola gigantica]